MDYQPFDPYNPFPQYNRGQQPMLPQRPGQQMGPPSPMGPMQPMPQQGPAMAPGGAQPTPTAPDQLAGMGGAPGGGSLLPPGGVDWSGAGQGGSPLGPRAAGPGNRPDDKLIAALLGGSQAGSTNKLAHSRKMADAIRGGSMDQLKGTSVGGQYIAPNMANLAASILGSWRAGKMDAAAQGQAEGLDAEAKRQKEEWLQRLMQGT